MNTTDELPLPAAQARYWIHLVEGAGSFSAVPVEEPLLLGRASECDLRLPDPAVSRRQLRILPAAGGVEVEWLKGKGRGRLRSGESLRVGDSRLVVLREGSLCRRRESGLPSVRAIALLLLVVLAPVVAMLSMQQDGKSEAQRGFDAWEHARRAWKEGQWGDAERWALDARRLAGPRPEIVALLSRLSEEGEATAEVAAIEALLADGRWDDAASRARLVSPETSAFTRLLALSPVRPPRWGEAIPLPALIDPPAGFRLREGGPRRPRRARAPKRRPAPIESANRAERLLQIHGLLLDAHGPARLALLEEGARLEASPGGELTRLLVQARLRRVDQARRREDPEAAKEEVARLLALGVKRHAVGGALAWLKEEARSRYVRGYGLRVSDPARARLWFARAQRLSWPDDELHGRAAAWIRRLREGSPAGAEGL